jgi:hypothetical protein
LRLLYVPNMKQEFTIAANGTWLSLAHAQLLKDTILFHFPELIINIITLPNKDADFSTSSLKSFTAENPADTPHAFIHSGDIRNIAIFNKNIEEKITAGEPLKIIIDKKLPQQLFERFLQKGLPKPGAIPVTIQFITTEDELENVLQNKEADGCIVPLACINDILEYPPLQQHVRAIIADKKWMLLPLFECPPLNGQGVVVATVNPHNTDAVAILEKCNKSAISATIKTETDFVSTLTDVANFGVFKLDTGTTKFSFAAGVNTKGNSFTNWDFEIPANLSDELLFSSTDYMKDFFSYQFLDLSEQNPVANKETINLLHRGTQTEWNTDFLLQMEKVPKADEAWDKGPEAVFISSHKAIHSKELFNSISQKRVWAAGTRTWYELAKKGIWVEGCADGLGMESLLATWQSPLINLTIKDFLIITNKASTLHWQADGWNTAATYELIPEPSAVIQEAVGNADFIFWTSFQQYEMYKAFVKPNTKHLCPAGKTAKLLLAEGFTPVIFPTIKAFLDWRSKIAYS